MARGFGRYWSILLACLTIAVCLLGCDNDGSAGHDGTTKAECTFNDFGGAFVIDTLPPVEITGEIIDAVVNRVNRGSGFQSIQGPDARTTLDFLRIEGRWFAALITRKNDSHGIGRCIIGKSFSKIVEFAYVRHIPLDSTNLEEYAEIIENDSAWVYFGDYGFWDDEDNWHKLFRGEEGYLKGILLLSRIAKNTSSSDPPGPMMDAIWTFDLSQIASKELQNWTTKIVPHLPQFTGVDYLATDSNWFVAIIVHRVAERVVYSPIVGEHFDDSLLYRQLYGEPIVLEGDSVSVYMNLQGSNELWTLINNGEWESDAAGIRQLWLQAAKGKDSTAITHKLTFPLDRPHEH